MASPEPRLFLVQEDVLPEAIYKTVLAKELLQSGAIATVAEAVERVSLSRSAYYKYKDKVYSLSRWDLEQTVILEMQLEHRLGVLSAVLNRIAATGGNIVTVNQNLPRQGIAGVTLTIETAKLNCRMEKLLRLLRDTKGVQKVQLLGT